MWLGPQTPSSLVDHEKQKDRSLFLYTPETARMFVHNTTRVLGFALVSGLHD